MAWEESTTATKVPGIVIATTLTLLVLCILCILLYVHRKSSPLNASSLNAADCAVVFGEHPDASRPGRTVCFDVGHHPDVSTRHLPFPPQYVKVSHGYKLLAFAQRQFGEPVLYRMTGPSERIIRCDSDGPHNARVRSLIVTLGITHGVKVDDCPALVRMRDGNKICARENTVVTMTNSKPISADVQAGYRLVAMSGPNFSGQRIADFTGPIQKTIAPRSASAWTSVRTERCLVALYSLPNLDGARRCVNGDVPSLAAFRPASFALAENCTIRVYSQRDFAGDVVFAASGPRTGDCPTSTLGKWNSMQVEIKDLQSAEDCMFIHGAAPSDRACLGPGRYTSLASALDFEPVSYSLPDGMRVTATHGEEEDVIDTKLGPWNGTADWSHVTIE